MNTKLQTLLTTCTISARLQGLRAAFRQASHPKTPCIHWVQVHKHAWPPSWKSFNFRLTLRIVLNFAIYDVVLTELGIGYHFALRCFQHPATHTKTSNLPEMLGWISCLSVYSLIKYLLINSKLILGKALAWVIVLRKHSPQTCLEHLVWWKWRVEKTYLYSSNWNTSKRHQFLFSNKTQLSKFRYEQQGRRSTCTQAEQVEWKRLSEWTGWHAGSGCKYRQKLLAGLLGQE